MQPLLFTLDEGYLLTTAPPDLEYHTFNITVIQVYAPTNNAEEAEAEQFYEDLQELLEITPPQYVLLIIGDWNEKVESQETPGLTGKFGLGIQNEAGQRLIQFCQENTLGIARDCISMFYYQPKL